jgi:hypothetical protein
VNESQARARIAEADLHEEVREPVGDLMTLWPLLKPDPIVAELAPLGERRTTWWERLMGRVAA